MYYNGDQHYDVSEFFNEVHKDLVARYNLNQHSESESVKAARMTNFFQKIKDFSKDPDKTDSEADFYNQLLDILQKSKVLRNHNLKTLFSKGKLDNSKSGLQFEKEVAGIMSILATGRVTKKNLKKMATGNVKAISTEEMDKFLTDYFKVTGLKDNKAIIEVIDKDLPEGVIASLLELVPKSIQKIGEDDQKKESQYKAIFSKISAKIDNERGSIQVTKSWNVSNETRQAIDDILSAKFTSKSYARGQNIGIGSTNIMRVWFSVLSTVNGAQDYLTQSSSLLHAINLMNCNKSQGINRQARWENTALHIYHMRFIYELTGLGLKGELGDLGSADYLLYNESNNDNIYVYSTKEIISQLFDNISTFQSFSRTNPFECKMYLRLEWLGLHSNYKSKS